MKINTKKLSAVDRHIFMQSCTIFVQASQVATLNTLVRLSVKWKCIGIKNAYIAAV